MRMKASDLMSSPAITVPVSAPVTAVAALLASHGFTAAPVLDEQGHLAGIVTEADLLRDRIRPEGRPATEGAAGRPVAEVMTGTPMAMRPDDDLADVVLLMLDGHVRSVPVIDDGAVVGVLSRRDVLRVIARGELSSEQVRERRGLPTGAGTAQHPAGPGRTHYRPEASVVVGVDGSPSSRAALRYAAAEAVRRGAWLTVVTAIAPRTDGPGADEVPVPTREGLFREVEREVRGIVAGELSRTVAGAVGAVRVRVLPGGPAEVLVEQARGADLLVVGRRDRAPGLGLLIGSVGLQCLQQAPCTVSVVPGPAPVSVPSAAQPAGTAAG